MKLDVTCMRYLSKDDYRVLTAVEQGMRNHELVPVELITSIARLRHGGSYKILSTLLRHKLLAHEQHNYDGYRLSYLGYDILALRTLLSRGTICAVGPQIGVGKESDIFEAQDENGEEVVIKIHRLGRTSFRAVRKNRDYMQNRSKANWLYMSRLAAVKEYAFMGALYANDFPTPTPIDQNRHVVVMSRVPGFPMAQIKAGNMEGAEDIFKRCLFILKRLAQHGLVHCDFNEFNLMVDASGHLTMIDFPQMVPVSHPNAEDLFRRDLNCLIKFFAMKMRFVASDEDQSISLIDLVESTDEEAFAGGIYDQVKASKGLSSAEDSTLIEFIMHENDMSEEMACARGREGNDGGSDSEGTSDSDRDGGLQETLIDAAINKGDGVPATSANVTALPAKHDASCNLIDAGAVQQRDEGEVTCWRSLNSAHLAAATESRDKLEGVVDSDDEGEEGQGEGSEAGALPVSEADIRNKIRRNRSRQHGKQGSRNSTKKRNKYGKIDKQSRDVLL